MSGRFTAVETEPETEPEADVLTLIIMFSGPDQKIKTELSESSESVPQETIREVLIQLVSSSTVTEFRL